MEKEIRFINDGWRYVKRSVNLWENGKKVYAKDLKVSYTDKYVRPAQGAQA